MKREAGVMPPASTACPLCTCPRNRPERLIKGYTLVRCGDCGFVFVNPRLTEAEASEMYGDRDTDALVRIYSRIGSSPSVQAEYARKLAWLEELLPGKGRLLDFACGAGHFFEQAQQAGWDAHGSELGAWARTAAENRGLKDLHVGTLSSIGFADAWFDVVYCAQVFEHLPDPRQELRELRRVLRPGGLLYVDVPNYRTLSIVMGRDDFMLNEPPQHINYFAPQSLRRLLETGGFEAVRITSGGGLKWENLLGKPIRSEIRDAYEQDAEGAQAGPAAPRSPPTESRLKRLLKSGLITPVFYDGLKMGMVLVGVARRPNPDS